ncbi:hypothetical protein [Jejuia pallidilutea]|uniref:Putative membrane protein n=2 Tax=Jejuia pallidilutea TaxID=504487 RepID=A0A090WF85_9FLAO|nr:hypothetical protein [Jejuia pallidilutea]GAL66197.1 putative membrane protein [Jejuia pallidilutea]GAL88223.1 putative membrane protein [Jejuia pallidilutea]
MYFYLIIALQAFCIYHVIKHRNPYYWIFLIFFIPLLGSVIYILTQVYNKRDADKITSGITNIINPTKKIRDLEKKLEFSETYQNRVNLADAYLEIGDNEKALKHYKDALEGNFQNDFYVIKNMIEAFTKIEDYKSVVTHAEHIKSHPEFVKSRTQFLYGLALEKEGKLEEAEENLKAIDVRFSFYNERLVYAQFLLNINKKVEAQSILESLISEGQYMTKPNKKIYGATIADAKKLLESL